MDEVLALPPQSKEIALIIIDLPVPVSPVKILSPSVKEIFISSTIAKFLIYNSDNIKSLPYKFPYIFNYRI